MKHSPTASSHATRRTYSFIDSPPLTGDTVEGGVLRNRERTRLARRQFYGEAVKTRPPSAGPSARDVNRRLHVPLTQECRLATPPVRCIHGMSGPDALILHVRMNSLVDR